MEKRIILSPQPPHVMAEIYDDIAKNCEELLLASAFLTEWPIETPLNKNCNGILVLIGTDFGLTRRHALTTLLKWMPDNKKSNVLAASSLSDGSFHPKLVAWKANNKYFALIGSSNLTKAAFNKNFEANVLLNITKKEFQDIKDWLRGAALKAEVVTKDWIGQYKEAVQARRSAPSDSARDDEANNHVIDLKITAKFNSAIQTRREKQEAFSEIKDDFLKLVHKCSSGRISNSIFWSEFWLLWANHPSRFQGSGIQFSGKNADWQEACRSLERIINVSTDIFDKDLAVQTEIDFLCHNKNPVRKAWLSEILCHLYPKYYPVLNSPVASWLKMKNYRFERGSSEGSKYIDLARKLRNALAQNRHISDLAELDTVIWNVVEREKNQS